MALINCFYMGESCVMNTDDLTPYREEIDNENEHTVVTGWKLGNVVVQNDVNMVLKKGSVVADAMAGSFT